ncbi:MAG: DNA replication/repair protein RecF [Spirulina sp. DLM2.Bin59]|nr:MAG: DNA replication/repair protein RecF [Spirulina sp. DLM2.Bin59]
MYLQHLHLRNFRNYRDQALTFTAPKTIILGNNAQGKSNLLEAIELLATLKSHRSSRDRDLIHHSTDISQINATIAQRYSTVELGCTLRHPGRRTLSRNCEPLKRQLDALGTLNAVQFSSLDLDLVRGTPDDRRRWLDDLVVQLEPVYAHILQQYTHVLRQRNALLRRHRGEQTLAPQELALWDAQLAAHGSRVTRRRARVLQRLAPLAQAWHSEISGSSQPETLTLTYCPNVPWQEDDPQQVQQAFFDRIQQRQRVETQRGTTVVGPHRDEIELCINDIPARAYASQGQQRTLVLAIKLAELHLIETVTGEPPLLLLDDVLAELDLQRQNHLLAAIQDRFQTVITTTHLAGFDAAWQQSAQQLTVESGKIASPAQGLPPSL